MTSDWLVDALYSIVYFGAMDKPTLYIFSGLPGAGKTALAKGLAKAVGASYLRIDTIEQAIRDLCDFKVEGEGYRLTYRVASDNLQLGNSVVADSCNPIELTRDEWEDIARKAGAHFENVEVVCSDIGEHRRRVEGRECDIPGFKLPTWDQVQNREYHPWQRPRIQIDTAAKNTPECLGELLKILCPEASS